VADLNRALSKYYQAAVDSTAQIDQDALKRQREQELAQQQAAARATAIAKQEAEGSQTIWQTIGGYVGGGFSTAGKVLDAVVPDDSRAVPGLNVVAAAGSAVVDNAIKPATVNVLNTYDDLEKKKSLTLSVAANAINPKYWQNRDINSDLINDSRDISPGRALTAAVDGLASMAGPLAKPLIGTNSDDQGLQGIYASNPEFDIADENERQKMFDENLSLRLASGLVDTTAMWFLDPGVIFGKGYSVARRGTTMFGKSFSGVSARTVIDTKGNLNQATLRAVEKDLDNALTGIKTNAPVDNPMTVVADRIVKGSYDDLLKLDQFQGPNRDQAAAIGSLITKQEDALNFLGASYGIAKHQNALAASANDVWVALQRAAKPSIYETAILNTPSGTASPVLLGSLLEDRANVRKVIQGLAEKDPRLAEELKRSDALTSAISQADGGGFLNFVGGTNAQGMRVAQAWRDGKQVRKAVLTTDRAGSMRATKARGAEIKAAYGTAPALTEKVFQVSQAFPRVRVWDWAGGSVANGHINIRDFNDGKAADELRAALSDSATVRKNKEFVQEQLRIFGAAGSSPALRVNAIKRIEQNVSNLLAEKHGSSRTLMDDLYKRLDKNRSGAIERFQKSGYGVDPEDGSLIVASAVMRSQLARSMPMLDMRVLEKSAKIAGRDIYKGIDDAAEVSITKTVALAITKSGIDELETLWKAGVLLRLGYTQRNLVEGWLRSVAYLGTIPAWEKSLQGLSNSFYNTSRRVRSTSTSRAEKFMPYAVGSKIPKTGLVRQKFLEQQAITRVNELQKRIAQAELLMRKNAAGDPDIPMAKLQQQLQSELDSVQKIQERIANLTSRRRIGDDGAFAGEYGDIIRRLSGADQTNQQFLESAFMRNRDEILSEKNWKIVNPGDKQYWDELSNTIRQFRADDIGLKILEGKSIGEIVAFIKKTPEGRRYRNDMQLPYSEVEGKVVQLFEMIENYLPLQSVRNLAAKADVSPAQLQVELGSLAKGSLTKPPVRAVNATDDEYNKILQAWYKKNPNYNADATLAPIHGREVRELTTFDKATDLYQKPIKFLFRILGTLPETSLVRHPFYAEVWARQTNGLRDLAIRQGKDIDPLTVAGAKTLEQIDRAAHRYAMRATNETLYTIERYSNLANTFRWFSPFIAAWENSFKVWTKMVVNDPSIAARASILWDIPAQLGLVVDKDGNKVEGSRFDFLNGNSDQYIVLPAMMNEVVMKFTGGIPLKVPRGSFNFVFPGSTPYLPGFGPIATFPAGVILAQRPDMQKFLRDNLGDDLYNQIAPFGEPQNNLVDAFAPPWARKFWQRWQGQSDQDYLKVVGAISQTTMIDWYKSGGAIEDKPTSDEVMQKANDFYIFSMLTSGTAPVSTTRMSKYQTEIDAWNVIKEDPSMTFSQKQEMFLSKYGEEFLPIVVSTSKSDIPGLDPTIEDYNLLQKHGSLAKTLAESDPRAIGIIASSAQLGEFDQGVYKWLNEQDIPGMQEKYRGAKNPAENIQSVNMTKAWRTYRASKAVLDNTLSEMGLSSLEVKAAADLKAQWKAYVTGDMVRQFGEDWITEYNSYVNSSPVYLTNINKVLANDEFMKTTGNSELWRGVSNYMDSRQIALDAIAQGADRQDVLAQFGEYVNTMRFGSLAFSDFYDKFLDQDQINEMGLNQIEQ